jgi:hypothetical protein
MKSSTKKILVFGCSGIGLAALLIGGAALWLVFSIASSINNNMTGGYVVSGGKVNYYAGLGGFGPPQSWEIKEADAATFKDLGEGYAKDQNNAYFAGVILPQSSGASFKIIQKPYAADQNHVYYEKWILSDAPADFKFISQDAQGILATDGKKVFLGPTALFPETVDAGTFERIGATVYFKDKNHVYTEKKIIEDADPATFKVIPGHNEIYAKDKTGVFYDAVRIKDCDGAAFQILESNYSRDGRNAFWKATKISDDAPNFKAFPGTTLTAYAKDGKNVFWCDKKLDKADPRTFVGLSYYYGKDKNNVWFGVSAQDLPEIVEKADPASFEIDEGDPFNAKDKNNYFESGRIKGPR